MPRGKQIFILLRRNKNVIYKKVLFLWLILFSILRHLTAKILRGGLETFYDVKGKDHFRLLLRYLQT